MKKKNKKKETVMTKKKAQKTKVALDTSRKDDALPLLSGLQRLDMHDAQATVEEWVGDQLEATTALRVRHMAERHHMANV